MTEKFTPHGAESLKYILGDMAFPLRVISRKIAESVENGSYDFVIGDDASGRIPALALEGFIKKVSADCGIPAPELKFIAGSRRISGELLEKKNAELGEFFEKISREFEKTQGKKPTRALVVTDALVTGRGLDALIDSLRSFGIAADVAAVGNVTGAKETESLKAKWGGEVISGDTTKVPDIYGEERLSGVKKLPENAFSTPLKDPAMNENELFVLKSDMAEARKWTSGIADALYEDWKLRKELGAKS